MASIVIEPVEGAGAEDDAPTPAALEDEQAGTLADDEALSALREKLVGTEE